MIESFAVRRFCLGLAMGCVLMPLAVLPAAAQPALLDTDGLPGLRSLQDMRSGPRHVRWLAGIDLQLPLAR